MMKTTLNIYTFFSFLAFFETAAESSGLDSSSAFLFFDTSSDAGARIVSDAGL